MRTVTRALAVVASLLVPLLPVVGGDETVAGADGLPVCRPPTMEAGPNHSILSTTAGTTLTWGYNGLGQLGDGTFTDRHTAIAVPGMDDAVSTAAGYGHSLVARRDGTVWAWGYNSNSQLGGSSSYSPRPTPAKVEGLESGPPVRLDGPDHATAVAAGLWHSLARKADGTVWSWGYGSTGQMGNGSINQQWFPVQALGLVNVGSIAAGSYHVFAIDGTSNLWAWGFNNAGQLGDGTTMDRTSPVLVPGISNVRTVAGGEDHTVAVTQDGTVWAWGDNDDGQIGNGAPNSTDYTTPQQVPGLSGAIAVSAGNDSSFALKSDGTVWAWGDNTYGQLGDGTTTDRATPVQVTGLTGVTRIAAGYFHVLALRNDGTVRSWGRNTYGQLGNGTTTDSHSPVTVTGVNANGTCGPLSGAQLPSARCQQAGGALQIVDGTSQGVHAFVYVRQPTPSSLDVCYRAESATGGAGVGGVFTITPTAPEPTVGGIQPPSQDDQADACTAATSPPNLVPGEHPMASVSVLGQAVMVDAYATSRMYWICLRVGTQVAVRVMAEEAPSWGLTTPYQLVITPDPTA